MEGSDSGEGGLPPAHFQDERFQVLGGAVIAIVEGEERRYVAGESSEYPRALRSRWQAAVPPGCTEQCLGVGDRGWSPARPGDGPRCGSPDGRTSWRGCEPMREGAVRVDRHAPPPAAAHDSGELRVRGGSPRTNAVHARQPTGKAGSSSFSNRPPGR